MTPPDPDHPAPPPPPPGERPPVVASAERPVPPPPAPAARARPVPEGEDAEGRKGRRRRRGRPRGEVAPEDANDRPASGNGRAERDRAERERARPPRGTRIDRPRGLPAHEQGPQGRRHRQAGWKSKDVLRTAALVIAFYLTLRLLWFAHTLVLVVFLATLFGLAVSSGVDRLQRWRIPRGIGAALIVFGFVGSLVGFVAWMAPTLRTQSHELRTKLPEAIDKAEGWLEKKQSGLVGLLRSDDDATTATAAAPATAAKPGTATPAATAPAATAPAGDTASPIRAQARRAEAAGPARADSAALGGTPATAAPSSGARGTLSGRVLQGMGSVQAHLFSFVTSTFAALGGLAIVIFLSIYIATSPRTYHDGLLLLFPRAARGRAGEVLTAVATALRRWLVTQLIAMLVIGAVSTGGLLLLGVKAALPLGILAGLLEFVPTVGPIMSAVPAIAMGFVDSPDKALYVAIMYVGVQFVENHLLIPLLMKSGVDLPPAVTIITQALMAMLFGFLGLLVAVPLVAASAVVLKMLYVEDVIGEPVAVPDDDDDD